MTTFSNRTRGPAAAAASGGTSPRRPHRPANGGLDHADRQVAASPVPSSAPATGSPLAGADSRLPSVSPCSFEDQTVLTLSPSSPSHRVALAPPLVAAAGGGVDRRRTQQSATAGDSEAALGCVPQSPADALSSAAAEQRRRAYALYKAGRARAGPLPGHRDPKGSGAAARAGDSPGRDSALERQPLAPLRGNC